MRSRDGGVREQRFVSRPRVVGARRNGAQRRCGGVRVGGARVVRSAGTGRRPGPRACRTRASGTHPRRAEIPGREPGRRRRARVRVRARRRGAGAGSARPVGGGGGAGRRVRRCARVVRRRFPDGRGPRPVPSAQRAVRVRRRLRAAPASRFRRPDVRERKREPGRAGTASADRYRGKRGRRTAATPFPVLCVFSYIGMRTFEVCVT